MHTCLSWLDDLWKELIQTVNAACSEQHLLSRNSSCIYWTNEVKLIKSDAEKGLYPNIYKLSLKYTI